jgi:hypothetical protein
MWWLTRSPVQLLQSDKVWRSRFAATVRLPLCLWCSQQMQSLKDAGHPLWYHPSSLTNGGRFANNSPALLARQAALGMLAAAWHLYTGGRPAECFRMRWGDSAVPGVHGQPPVWALGLAGLLPAFQETPGTGYTMVRACCL